MNGHVALANGTMGRRARRISPMSTRLYEGDATDVGGSSVHHGGMSAGQNHRGAGQTSPVQIVGQVYGHEAPIQQESGSQIEQSSFAPAAHGGAQVKSNSRSRRAEGRAAQQRTSEASISPLLKSASGQGHHDTSNGKESSPVEQPPLRRGLKVSSRVHRACNACRRQKVGEGD